MLIGIIGKKRSGKDTVASMIYTRDPERYRICPLALGIKGFVSDVLQIPVSRVEELKLDETQKVACGTVSMRQILQNVGQYFKQYTNDELFWCKRVSEATDSVALTIVSDVRLRCEYEYFKEKGAIFVKVVRSNTNVEEDTHITEIEVDTLPYDLLIVNDGSLLELQTKVQRICDHLKV